MSPFPSEKGSDPNEEPDMEVMEEIMDAFEEILLDSTDKEKEYSCKHG